MMCQGRLTNCSKCSPLVRDMASEEGHLCVGPRVYELSVPFQCEPKATLINKIDLKSRIIHPVGKTVRQHSLQTLLADMQTNATLLGGNLARPNKTPYTLTSGAHNSIPSNLQHGIHTEKHKMTHYIIACYDKVLEMTKILTQRRIIEKIQYIRTME